MKSKEDDKEKSFGVKEIVQLEKIIFLWEKLSLLPQ